MNLLDIFQDSKDLKEYPADTVLFSEGRKGDYMYVVIEGEVEISLHHKILAIAGPGEMVGEMALINSELRSATATTQSHCVLAYVDRASFESMLRHVPDFAMHVMNRLTTRIKSAFEQTD
jgi:CRP/FNR family cyclic AMP-dependent transcriptional regulator